jgi:hypothetical protein
MNFMYVESSNLVAIGYDASTSTLGVEFKSGGTWHYYNVPEYIWSNFQYAPSKGKYFHQNIRGQYTEQRVN